MRDPDELMRVSRETLEMMLNESGKTVFDRVLATIERLESEGGDIATHLRENMKEILK